jgi:GTP cyclohydrolase I
VVLRDNVNAGGGSEESLGHLKMAESPQTSSAGVDPAALLELHPRHLSGKDLQRLEGYAADILTTLGLDLDTPATRETPHRFIEALAEATKGYEGDPKLLKVFDTECYSGSDCIISQVIEGPIRFFSLCEHHALPFFGQAYLGYVADEKIVGLSKLTRIMRVFTRRFAVQERIGQQIADALELMIEPHGVAVLLEARHLCVEMRGVREPGARTYTTAWRGEYEHNAEIRREFLAACGRQQSATLTGGGECRR